MKQNPGGTDSPWQASELSTQLPSLDADLQTDVCIVGGGISGMTTAYLLAREGRSVVVRDHEKMSTDSAELSDLDRIDPSEYGGSVDPGKASDRRPA